MANTNEFSLSFLTCEISVSLGFVRWRGDRAGTQVKGKELKNGINYSTSGRALPVTLAGGAAGKDFSFAEHSGIKGWGGQKTKKREGGVILKFKRTLKVYIL